MTIYKILVGLILATMLMLAVLEIEPMHCESDSCFYTTRTAKGN